jgi:hypothetical protein
MERCESFLCESFLCEFGWIGYFLAYVENLTLPEAKVIEISEKSLEAIEDLCKMEELHESLIMENLKKRYKENTIYVCCFCSVYFYLNAASSHSQTYIGPMVVSINPFKVIEKYGEHVIPDYRTKDKDQLPAHIYSTAHQAHQFVCRVESEEKRVGGFLFYHLSPIVLLFLYCVCRFILSDCLDCTIAC